MLLAALVGGGTAVLCTVKYDTAGKRLAMRTRIAIVLGRLSGLMLFLLSATVTGSKISSGPNLAVALLALLTVTAISAYLLRRNTAATSTQSDVAAGLLEPAQLRTGPDR